MTLKELKDRVDIRLGNGYGQYVITIEYRGKKYECRSTNATYYDIIRTGEPQMGYTVKDAYRYAYEECKRKNTLGEYNK